jgi:hypothetical protein
MLPSALSDYDALIILQEDLRDFHAKHFPHATTPDHVLHGVESEPVEDYYEEEAGLGFYADGTPRTLTDEQIAMFRHSEIQTIIRKRRQLRDNGHESEEGEVEESVVSDSAMIESPASLSTSTTIPDAERVISGRVEKLKSQQWTTSSPRTKAKNKRNRDKYKAKKRDERFKREQARKNEHDEDEESDEWDPWHQAKGPDVQKDETVDLDY